MIPSTGSIVLRLGLLCLCLSTLVSTQVSPALAVVHVPLTASNDNQRYIANVNMSVGPQTQRFGFALSTTTGYTIVAAASCANCTSNNIPTYNSTLSNSAKAIDSGEQQQTVRIAGGTVNAGRGIASKEDCALREVNGNVWTYPNQTIIQTNSSSVFQAGVSGMIGLGTNTADFGDTAFAGWLSRNPTLSNFTFGLALSPLPDTQAVSSSESDQDNSNNGSAGTLHLQQPDPSSYTGAIRWQNVQSVGNSNVTTNSSGLDVGNIAGSSWLIQMDGWSFASGSAQTDNSQTGLAAIEPYFLNIYLPQAHATQIYASLVGSSPLPVTSSDVGQAYSIPCDADITFTAILSGYGYILPKETLVIKAGNGSCIGAIEGWINPTANNFLLGSRFISTVYIIFQIGQLPTAQQQVGIAQRSSNPMKNSMVGKIVGGVVGGIGFIIIIGGVAFWWLRRRGKRITAGSVIGDKQELQSGREKSTPEAPGESTNHWKLSPVSNIDTTSHSSYATYSPSTANFPPSSTAYQTSFPAGDLPSGTETSGAILLPGPSPPPVKQWVSNLTPTRASHSPTGVVPAEYDYGNDGKPGTLVSPSSPDGFGRMG